MTAYHGQTLTQTTLGQLYALWDFQSRTVVIQPIVGLRFLTILGMNFGAFTNESAVMVDRE